MAHTLFVSAVSVTGGGNGAALGGGSVTVTCAEAGGSTADGVYIWYQDGDVIPGATGQTHAIDPATDATAGTYKCKATFTTTDVESEGVVFKIYGKERSFQERFIYNFILYRIYFA